MSEPFWTPLGGQPVDYEGAWAAGTAYAPGDVVLYNGVYYVAVNPSQGSTPPAFAQATGAGVVPLVTALPASPFDGQEVILTDSLTAPTFTWRLRYVAAKASNKWMFVGGPPVESEVTTYETLTDTSYANLATVGPSVTVPIAGDYLVEFGCMLLGNTNPQETFMSFAVGATAASDNDSMRHAGVNLDDGSTGAMTRKKTGLAASTALVAKYRVSQGTGGYSRRWMKVTPIAVGG